MVAVLLPLRKTPGTLYLIWENHFSRGISAAVAEVFCHLAGTAALEGLPEG